MKIVSTPDLNDTNSTYTVRFRTQKPSFGLTNSHAKLTSYPLPNSEYAVWIGQHDLFNKSDLIRLIFGRSKTHSCHTLPYHLTVYQGGAGVYSLPSDPCSERDINQDICFGCKPGFVYNLKSKDCTKNPNDTAKNDTCFDNGFCISQYHIESVLPFCIKENNLKCFQCQEGYLLNSLYYCVPKCSDGYFAEFNESHLVWECKKCTMDGCDLCMNNESCMKCMDGLVLHQSKCLEKCPQGFYQSETSCLRECPVEYYTNHSDFRCYSCGPGCSSCNMANCLQCKEGYQMYNKKCYEIGCFDPKLAPSKTCGDCPQNCAICYLKQETGPQCLQCFAPFFLSSNKTCIKNCPKDYSRRGDDCIFCPIRLRMPDGTTICNDDCPPGFYKLKDDTDEYESCFPCPPGCSICHLHELYVQPYCDNCSEALQMQGLCVDKCLPPFVESLTLCQDPALLFKLHFCNSHSKYYSAIRDKYTCSPTKIQLPYLLKLPFTLKVSNRVNPIMVNFNSLAENCETRDYDGHCLTCKRGFYLYDSKYCSKICPAGMMVANTGNVCTYCSTNCEICLDNRCKVCYELLMLDGRCHPFFNVPLSYYQLFYYTLEGTNEGFFEKTFQVTPKYAEAYKNTSSLLQINNLSISEESYHINLYLPLKNGSLINPAQNICDPSCLVCQQTLTEHSSYLCLRCLPQLQNSTIIDQGYCVCPSEKPFFDHVQNSCVSECPIDRLIINDTKECVETCMQASYFSNDAFVFQLHKYCLKECPENYSPEVDWPLINGVRCRFIESYYLYLSALELKNLPTRVCSQSNSSSVCKLEPALNLESQYITKLDQYIASLSKDSEITSTLFEPSSHELFYHYISSQNPIQGQTKFLLKLLQHFAYACQTQDHRFYVLSSLEILLSKSNNLQALVEELPEIFESIADCFEASTSFESLPNIQEYSGEVLNCEIQGVNRTSLKDELIMEQKFAQISLESSIKTYSLLKNPYTILRCSVNSRIAPNSHLSFYSLHFLSKHDKNHWWYTDILAKLTFDITVNELLIWNPTSTKFYSSPSSLIEAHLNFTQESPSLMLLIIERGSNLNPDDPNLLRPSSQNSLLVFYLSLAAFGLIVIGLLWIFIKNFTKGYSLITDKPGGDSESVIEITRKYELNEENQEDDDVLE